MINTLKRRGVLALAVLFIVACSGSSEAEELRLDKPATLSSTTQETTTIVTIEVEEEAEIETETEPLPEAGSFEYYCYIIERAAEEEGVPTALAVAISRLETGNFTSDAFLYSHNFGGLTGAQGIMSFASEEAGLDAFVACLAWYNQQGMTTPQKMASVYCPSNGSWASQVEEIMEEHK